jgi:[methyl-Co(III) methanol-specific corrinoid protein]:coenzyme M methyltransferase
MATEMTSRERVLKLFNREPVDRLPIFSGMGNVTVHGLEGNNLRFAELHVDAGKMAQMAATTSRIFGFECAVVPFDMGVEAEALGAGVNFYSDHTDIVYPTIIKKAADKFQDLTIQVPDLSRAGRIPLVAEAIRILKKQVGDSIAIGAWVLGPYTLAGQLTDIGDLAKSAFKKTDQVREVLNQLADVIIEISRIYREAGADYITIREMGAGPDILSPRMFKALIQAPLEKVFAGLPSPKILHICGSTDTIIEQMAQCGADAISVDQKNTLAETRKKIGRDLLLFGNFSPYDTLVLMEASQVEPVIKKCLDDGADAVWPGCDLWPDVKKENMEAMMAAALKYGQRG